MCAIFSAARWNVSWHGSLPLPRGLPTAYVLPMKKPVFSTIAAAFVLASRVHAADDPYLTAAHALANGRAQDAVAAFGEAMTREPDSVTGHFQKALDWRGKQKWEHAMDELNAALAVAPGHAPSLAMRGILQYELQKFDLAIADADAALKSDPGNAFAHFVKARVFMMPATFDPVRNRREVDEAIKLDPTFATAYRHRSGTHRISRELEAALADATRAIELEPTVAENYRVRAWSLSELNRWKDALPDCEQAAKLEPENAEYRTWQADARFLTGDLDGAASAAAEAVRVDRRGYYKFGASFIRARALSRLQRFEEARGAFDLAVQHEPKREEALAGRAFVRMMTGDTEGALRDANRLHVDEKSLMFRAWTFLALARYDEASQIARGALKGADWSLAMTPYAAIVASIADANRGKTAEAQAVLAEAAGRIDAKQWPGPIIAFLTKNQTKETLLAAAKDNGQQTEAHAYIGIQAAIAGRRDEALEHLGWVRDHGNKDFSEYSLSLATIHRLPPAP